MSDIKKAVKSWAKKIGEREAVIKLISLGVSPRAAEQLCAGTYGFEPKAIRSKIIQALAGDGFSLTG